MIVRVVRVELIPEGPSSTWPPQYEVEVEIDRLGPSREHQLNLVLEQEFDEPPAVGELWETTDPQLIARIPTDA